jgi:type VI protein secretion system component VasK
VMIGGRGALVALAWLLLVALLATFGLVAMGEELGDLWADIRAPLAVLGACLALLGLLLLVSAAGRTRNRHRRPLARYQLVLSQADEATLEEVAAACEQLVQTVRESLTERLVEGQPWLALESWFVPPGRRGETGTAALMLLCEPRVRENAMAALRRAYPDLSLRPDPAGGDGEPLEFA